MPDIQLIANILGLIVLMAPVGLLLMVGLGSLADFRASERTIGRLVHLGIALGLCAAIAVLAIMLVTGVRHVPIDLGDWVAIPHFHFSLKFVFDRLSVPFVILTFVLCGTIGAFATSYLHREPGFNRFFVLFCVFLLGMILASLAGTIETLFAGWELVGISSALLVAFFQDRVAPVRNGLRVWAVYRVSDAALLLAAVVLHHLTGEGDFDKLMGEGWPYCHATLTSQQALFVGLLLLVAAAGKSALVPFCGWLPRAMEGPTPSSAVFYGSLSVHLGAYLLLRVSPLLELSPLLSGIVVAVGLLTAAFAALAGRAQTDIKSALSFASLTQVGIIVAEIGLGLRYIALIHIIGHACLRTLQFLRASSLLSDYRSMEDALGARLPATKGVGAGFVPAALSLWLYRLAIERGYFDALLTDYVARPFLAFFAACDSWERRWTDFVTGNISRESDRLPPAAGSLEDLS
jgi:NADH:ubiquinone oxidoreductase subunit 5 (subunit L)/multisubunit Na+/H+ antiporter MnhA subunit